jgi:hypothetical protein
MCVFKMSFAFFGLMIAPLAAQTEVPRQHSRAQSPNMPQAHETVPQHVRSQAPVEIEILSEDAQARDEAKQPNRPSFPSKLDRRTTDLQILIQSVVCVCDSLDYKQFPTNI